MSVSLSAFIERWRTGSDRERGRGDVFLRELCLALGLPLPSRPAAEGAGGEPYVLERRVRVPRPDGSDAWGVADLCWEGRFVLELTAPGAGLAGLERSRTRAFEVAENLAARPPFVVVCEAGRWFELYASFDGSGRYRAFPDGERKRLAFEDLERHAGTLRAVWTEPMLLDPAKRAARVTAEAVASVSALVAELRAGGHPGPQVAAFVLACLWTTVLEEAGVIGRGSWRGMLEDQWIPEPASFPGEVEALWRGLAELGGARRVGVGEAKALPLTEGQLRRLWEATRHPWLQVDPVVAGALLERAIHPDARPESAVPETPRAHVERLVRPTVEDALRVEWSAVRAEVWVHLARRQPEAARRAVADFQRRLTGVRVLDPACGGGAFLCAALDVLGEIEGEAVAELRALGEPEAPRVRVGAEQMLGIDVDGWAAQIAEHMLWLAQIARRRRTVGPEALEARELRPVPGVERRDALLAWDAEEPVLDGKGAPVTRRYDEESKAVEVRQYVRPRPAEWPRADFIVGNVPFMDGKRLRSSRGEGYFAALQAAYPDVSADADLAMYWLDRAARMARQGEITRFGFVLPMGISTQRLLSRYVDVPDEPLQIVFAVVAYPGEAAVHVATVVGQRKAVTSTVELVTVEGLGTESFSSRQVPRIGSSLRPGASVSAARPLEANAGLCSAGIQLGGRGFVLPRDASLEESDAVNPVTSLPVVRPYVRGRDLVGRGTHERVIDFFGLDAGEAARLAPAVFRHVEEHVKPSREHGMRGASARSWWRFAADRPGFRAACRGLGRYIATPDIAKHRVFAFVDASVLPDQTLACIAHEDAYILGVLSSRVHVTWAAAAGGWFAVGPRYGKTTCFDPFPFPACTEVQKRALREVAERLDVHKKSRIAAHPDLTVTRMYNVLAKLRAGEALDDTERRIHDHGQVSILRQIHDELDRAVFAAYRWPADLPDDQVLEKVVALNQERIEEERGGFTRWLRPESRRSAGEDETRPAGEPPSPLMRERLSWPEAVREQIVAARDLVLASKHVWSAEELAAAFKGARKHEVAGVLDALAGVGVLVACAPARGPTRWGAPCRSST